MVVRTWMVPSGSGLRGARSGSSKHHDERHHALRVGARLVPSPSSRPPGHSRVCGGRPTRPMSEFPCRILRQTPAQRVVFEPFDTRAVVPGSASRDSTELFRATGPARSVASIVVAAAAPAPCDVEQEQCERRRRQRQQCDELDVHVCTVVVRGSRRRALRCAIRNIRSWRRNLGAKSMMRKAPSGPSKRVSRTFVFGR